MGAVTIRNLPDEVIDRVKKVAADHGRSMEQELRELIQTRYMCKADALRQIRARGPSLPAVSAADVRRWREEGRR